MKQGSGNTANPARRVFLSGKYFTWEGRDEVRRQGRLLGPLPPSLPAELLAQNPCKDCHHPCLPACDSSVIHLHPPTHRLCGVPYLSFQAGACTFCGDCVEACPLEYDREVTTRLGIVLLENDKCIAWNGVICLSCQSACTYQAVGTDPRGRPAIETDVCTGCGACVSVCPSNALRVPAPAFELTGE